MTMFSKRDIEQAMSDGINNTYSSHSESRYYLKAIAMMMFNDMYHKNDKRRKE